MFAALDELAPPGQRATVLGFGLLTTNLLGVATGPWVVGIVGFTLGHLWSGPESLTEKLLIFSGIAAMALLLLSVLIDRLKRLGSDRYRRIEK